MHLTVDQRRIADTEFDTLGQALDANISSGRIVTRVLVEGRPASDDQIGLLRTWPMGGLEVVVETSDRSEIARDIAGGAMAALESSEPDREAAVEALQAGDQTAALRSLGRCVQTWAEVHQAIEGLVRLGASPDQTDPTLESTLEGFASQLREIIRGIKSGDLVSLSDTLAYEAPESLEKLGESLRTMQRRAA
jgi:hypothetical protein